MRSLVAPLLLLAACGRTGPSTEVQPDAIATLDAMAGCGDADGCAWPLYQALLKDLHEPARGTNFACSAVPGNSEWQRLGTWLGQNRDLLPALLEATAKPHFGMSHRPQAGSGGTVANVDMLPMRMCANLLCAAARDSEGRGELDEALGYVDAVARLALQLAARPLVNDRSLGLAVYGIAGRECRRLLFAQAANWSAAQVEAFAASPLLELKPRATTEALRAERLLTKDEPRLGRVIDESEAGAQRELQQVRAVMALVAYRQQQGSFPDGIDDLGEEIAGMRRLRYLPPTATRGPVLYYLKTDGADPLQDAPPEEWDPLRVDSVLPVAPPR